jgi:hypothetical protein
VTCSLTLGEADEQIGQRGGAGENSYSNSDVAGAGRACNLTHGVRPHDPNLTCSMM